MNSDAPPVTREEYHCAETGRCGSLKIEMHMGSRWGWRARRFSPATMTFTTFHSARGHHVRPMRKRVRSNEGARRMEGANIFRRERAGSTQVQIEEARDSYSIRETYD